MRCPHTTGKQWPEQREGGMTRRRRVENQEQKYARLGAMEEPGLSLTGTGRQIKLYINSG
jgi:hypothetical protein